MRRRSRGRGAERSGRSGGRWALVLGLVAIAWGAGAPAAAEDIRWFTAWRLLSEADDAFRAGDAERAEELYLRVADGRPREDARRARALLGAVKAQIAAEGPRDDGLARARLDALLTSYPASEQAEDARVLRELVARKAPPPRRPPPPTPAPPPDETPVESDAERVLKLQIARLEAELRAARAELAEKEAALERLKQAIVGDG